ncbi:MAG TPA: dethiobiotin synthase [Candidatus Binatia bacterium]|nr:dethiobiotin synthase [Candidatus Binatia bacterium]
MSGGTPSGAPPTSPNGRVLLVTGTDTGVGKTHVACGLVRALRSLGASVAVRKPAETGCAPALAASRARTPEPAAGAGEALLRDGQADVLGSQREPIAGTDLWPADGAALRDAAGGGESLGAVCPYRFAEPLAPAVAARRAGVEIDVRGLVRDARRRSAEVGWLVVEGAGGLLVPLRGAETFADLAGAVGASLVLVVGARLGAINHALLTIEVARARGLAVAGLVVNHFGPTHDLAIDTLGESLRELAGVPLVATVPFGDDGAGALGAFASALGRSA